MLKSDKAFKVEAYKLRPNTFTRISDKFLSQIRNQRFLYLYDLLIHNQ